MNDIKLLDGRCTTPALRLYLAVLSDRPFNLIYCLIGDKAFSHLNIERWW